ncbi:hypothetical protein LXA43DRAFT_1090073 [Ganoderma leucocontextum]|nr:hypothetical protein LXA43DRAFT_1090073 [Ganoderma leucocontextum]
MATLESLQTHVYLLVHTCSKQYNSPDEVRSITLFVNGVASTFTASLPTADIMLTLLHEHELLQWIKIAEGDTLSACDLQDPQCSFVLTLLHAYHACYFQLGMTPTNVALFFRLVAEAAMALDEHELADVVLEELAAYVWEPFSATALGMPAKNLARPTSPPVMPAPLSPIQPPNQASVHCGSPAPASRVGGMKPPGDRTASAPTVTSTASIATKEAPPTVDTALMVDTAPTATTAPTAATAPTVATAPTISTITTILTVATAPTIDTAPPIDAHPTVCAPFTVDVPLTWAVKAPPIVNTLCTINACPPGGVMLIMNVCHPSHTHPPIIRMAAPVAPIRVALDGPALVIGVPPAQVGTPAPDDTIAPLHAPIHSTSVLVERTIGGREAPTG